MGAVPPDAAAAREGLSLSGAFSTSVPCTAAVTWAGTLLPAIGEGTTGGPPPGGVNEKVPGTTLTERPPD